MSQLLGWIGLVSVVFVFYMILKPQKWEKDLLKEQK